MRKPTVSAQRTCWVLAHCPYNGEEVIGRGWQGSFPVPDGQASWWNCPACQGWHVVVVQQSRQPGSPHDPVTLTQGVEQAKSAVPGPGMSWSGSHHFEISPIHSGQH